MTTLMAGLGELATHAAVLATDADFLTEGLQPLLAPLFGLLMAAGAAHLLKRRSQWRLIPIDTLIAGRRKISKILRAKIVSQMLRVGLTLTLLTCILLPISTSLAQPAESNGRLDESPSPNHPVRVDVNFFIDDISDIDLNAGTYKVTGQMIQEWKDPRLAFTPDPKYPKQPRDYDAEAAGELLKRIWDPMFEISNEDGERKTGVFSINIWPDGRIRTYEKFDSVASFSGDLRMYPYGAINLDLVMTGFLQNRNEMIYRLRRFEFQNQAKPNISIHGYWNFARMSGNERAVKRADDRSVDYSQIHFQIKLNHESFQSGVLLIFVPLLAVFAASCALLWVDPAATASYSSPRLGGTLTLILTTIALKFSLAKQIPTFEYLTLADLLIMVTVGMLVVSLIGSCAYLWLYSEKSRELATSFNRSVRVYYPVLFISVTAISVLIHGLLPSTR